MLELLHARVLIGQERHRECPNLLWDLLLEHPQRLFTLGGDEHTPTVGEKVTDDIGDRVSLARAGRPLHDNSVAGLELLDDRHLLAVIGHRKK